jgi:iron-sulfur cluster insertion protein
MERPYTLPPGPSNARLLFKHRRRTPIWSVMEPFRLTGRAARRIAEIAATQEAGAALRVAVLAGGCNGFQYRFDLDRPADDDIVVEQEGARVAIDPASLELLAGSELDYVDELMGAYFKVSNPQAKSSCGCGTSFSVD